MAHQTCRPATAADALAELRAGNQRFVAGNPNHPRQTAAYRTTLADVQQPFAVVLSCSDSRLATELIFDQGFGDLFVLRTAGHVVGPEVLASIGYGVDVLGAPLVVVLGHSSCGAIEATRSVAASVSQPDRRLRAIVDQVIPSVREAHGRGVTALDEIVELPVRRTAALLSGRSGALSGRVATGRCAVVGAMYRFSDGRVTVLDGTAA